MPDLVQFELVSPERLILSTEVEMVVVPGTEGNFGVLPGHAPLITELGIGELTYRAKGASEPGHLAIISVISSYCS